LQKETFNNLLKHGGYDENVNKGRHFIIQNFPYLPLITPRSRFFLEKHVQFFKGRASEECEKKNILGVPAWKNVGKFCYRLINLVCSI